jgi:DNA mismatch repair protein MutS2
MDQPGTSLHEATLRKLEFPQVLAKLAAECRFSVAAEKAAEVGPSGEIEQVRYLLSVTAEAVDFIGAFPDISIGGARDIRTLVLRAEKGGRLQPIELLQVLDMVGASRQFRRTFFRLPDAETRFPALADFAICLADLPDIETDISRSIGPRGDVLDTASSELSRIRREIRVAHGKLMDKLNSVLTSSKFAGALQEALITTRDGRYVLPVRSESRHAVAGVIHDTSSSGQTVFIEPLEVVSLNNAWREAQLEEQYEIERILDGLSKAVGLKSDALLTTVDGFAAIDLAMAKARLAFEMQASRPRLWSGANVQRDGHPTHRVAFTKARHPLLDPETVVPIDVEIGTRFRVMLITGPNTGGKTVALKTIGLLTLMAQAGLYVPAEEGSVISVFPAIFVDIGDEQSIAQSLSTFSGHMRTVVGMLRHVTSDSLVLLDELGAGTDPQEGSALARAIISALLRKGAMVVGTTHYSEVKAFAYATPGVENASVEFDVKSLAPTYRLMIGVPGRSNALAIAKRLGMPRDILDEAAGLLSPDEARADNLLQDIRRRRDEAEQAVARAKAAEAESDRLRREIQAELQAAERERLAARQEALAQAEVELAEVRDTLRRLQRDREMIGATRAHVETRRDEVDKVAETVRSFKRERIVRPPAPQSAKAISAGDRVLIVAYGQEAEVLSVDAGVAELQLGQLKTRQPLDALKRLGRARPEPEQQRAPRPALMPFVPMEIDIRGNRAAEIEGILERYLDEAYRAGLPYVRIIHGKGTGALRQAVRDLLHASPVVEKHEFAPHNEGGDGATIAHIRA